MKNDIRTILIVLLAFAAYSLLKDFYLAPLFVFFNNLIHNRITAYFVAYLLVGTPLFVATFYLHRKAFFVSLGLRFGFFKGMFIALLATLPMLVGYATTYPLNENITAGGLAQGVIFAALFEELYYRAFFFGLLFRYTGLGFFPALLLGALTFASNHLYQSGELATMSGIFITTLMGAGLFAWAYVEWNNNLWVPIFLHFFMNLFWYVFDAGDNALGPLLSNVFRYLTVAVIIIGTILYKRKKGQQLAVNRQTLWIRK